MLLNHKGASKRSGVDRRGAPCPGAVTQVWTQSMAISLLPWKEEGYKEGEKSKRPNCACYLVWIISEITSDTIKGVSLSHSSLPTTEEVKRNVFALDPSHQKFRQRRRRQSLSGKTFRPFLGKAPCFDRLAVSVEEKLLPGSKNSPGL